MLLTSIRRPKAGFRSPAKFVMPLWAPTVYVGVMSANAVLTLLLEDEPLIAMDIELTLRGAGFDVTTVVTCEEANNWLEICRPDIVIVDIELRDGPCHKIAEYLTEEKIPFIVHSGDHPSMHVDTPFAQGRWISKPAAADELIGAARELLAS